MWYYRYNFEWVSSLTKRKKSIKHSNYTDCSMEYVNKKDNKYYFVNLTYGVIEYTVLKGIKYPKGDLIEVTWEGLTAMLLGIEWEIHRSDLINYLYTENILSDGVSISTYAKPTIDASYVNYKIPDSNYYVRIRRSGKDIYELIHNCFMDLKLYDKRIEFVADNPFELTTELCIGSEQNEVDNYFMNEDYISDEQILKIFDTAENMDAAVGVRDKEDKVDSYNDINIINSIRFSSVGYYIFGYSIYLGKIMGNPGDILKFAVANFMKRTKSGDAVADYIMGLSMRSEWGVYVGNTGDSEEDGINIEGTSYRLVYNSGNEFGVRKFIMENKSSWLFSGLSFIEEQ